MRIGHSGITINTLLRHRHRAVAHENNGERAKEATRQMEDGTTKTDKDNTIEDRHISGAEDLHGGLDASGDIRQ